MVELPPLKVTLIVAASFDRFERGMKERAAQAVGAKVRRISSYWVFLYPDREERYIYVMDLEHMRGYRDPMVEFWPGAHRLRDFSRMREQARMYEAMRIPPARSD